MTDKTTRVAIPGSNRPTVPHAKLLGKSDGTKRIRVSIYARQNPAGVGKLTAASKSDFATQLPGKRRYLTDEQFAGTYGADPADLEKIASWAGANNLKVIDRSVKKRRALVEGTIDDINKAFGTQLNEYEHADLTRYRGREGKLTVPGDLHEIIVGVFGLDTRRVGHTRNRRRPGLSVDWQTMQATVDRKGKKGTLPNLSNQWPGVFFPPQVATLYNYPATFNGSSQNVAIFAFNGGTPPTQGGYSLAALKTYYEKVLGGVTPSITDVVVSGPGNDPGPDTPASGQQGDATGEVMLDMCVVGSVAPGAHIFMYFTEFTTQGWVDALSEAITDSNNISVISISYGNPEDDPNGAWTAMGVTTVNQAFEAAMAKGITICCASGDDGSLDQEPSGAHTDFPASSPNVLGVGGTTLVANSDSNPTSITSETVWNGLPQGGSGGGGVSVVFPKPAYQDGVNVPPNADPPHKIGRGVPDVSAVADPNTGVAVIHVDGKKLDPIGGTSASAPLWASLIARLNQGLNARCGFINTILYTKFQSDVLRDITQGNNGAYQAGPGWDACTGLGSPDGGKLLSAFSGKPVAAAKAAKRKK